MIARVLTDDDPPIELVLGDNRVWTCPEVPELADALNTLHDGTFTPAMGQPGCWQAHDAASRFGGKVTYLDAHSTGDLVY